MVAVSLKGSYTVKPAEPTFNGRLPLSEFDQIGTTIHIPAIYFYRPSQDWIKREGDILATLRESLSRVLVHFYPLAGRLCRIQENRLEIDCNGRGVELIEAESEGRLEDFGEFPSSLDLECLVPHVNCFLPIHEQPIMLVQLTKFSCGGVGLSPSISHVVTDGWSGCHVMNEWARLARGEPLGTPPFHDRKLLLAGDPPIAPPPPSDPTGYSLPPLLRGKEQGKGTSTACVEKTTTEAFFKLTKTQIETLEKMANEGIEADARPYGRFETVAAHIWRCACKARGHKPEQRTAVAICVDTRKRIQPPLPEGYFGNGSFDVTAGGISGELVSKPLGYACSKIREAIYKVTDEFIRSAIDFLKNQPDFSSFQGPWSTLTGMDDDDDDEEEEEEEEGGGGGPIYGNPNLGVVSWLALPMHGVDFGWGREMYVGPADHFFEGESCILPVADGSGSVVVVICLQASYINSFKNFFYKPIPDSN